MQDFVWLAGAVIVLMVLWLAWSLSRNATRNDPPVEVEMPRPMPRPTPPPADPATLTPIGLPKAEGPPDDLLQLKGVGPRLNALLGELGVTRYDQIAAWTGDDVATLDAHLGDFQGRVGRDNWVEQAGYLARGDIAGFEEKFGKLGG